MDKTEMLFADVLARAIKEVAKRAIPVYTFAFYHDHESGAVSVCVDTETNSQKKVRETNDFNMKYFAKAIGQGNLEDAALWQANIGRNLSLGDFVLVNLARTDIKSLHPNKSFYLKMVRSLIEQQTEITRLAQSPELLLFCCSGPDDEVKYVWSVIPRHD